MIRKLLTFSLNNRWLIVFISLILMGVGYYCFTQLKIEAYPDIADTNVMIVAQYKGKAAEEVEQQVTVPLERALQDVPDVLDRRSRTIFGLSVIQLTFKDGTDDYFARQRVQERLAEAELPENVLPELAPLSTAVGEIFRYVVEAPSTYSPTEIRDIQDWIVKPYLMQTPGIAEVATFGGPLKQFHVLTSPKKLRKYNITLSAIENAINQNNKNTGGDVLKRGGQGFAIRSLGAIKDKKDIEDIVLKSENGVPVFIRDVASVEIKPPPPNGKLGYTVLKDSIDVSNGVEGIILLRKYENSREVLQKLKKRISKLEKNELPEGVKIKTLYDRSFLIDHSLETIGKTLFQGVSIVVIVLIFFLGSLRSALVVSLTIPFSMLFAFILMYYSNIPANLLSLGAIDFGIIVDGSCVMAEHLIRRYKNPSDEEKQQSILQRTLTAAKEVDREIFFSVAIIILAYMPILLMTRVEGKLFSPMALTLAFAVVGAMVAAVTLIPVLIALVFRKIVNHPEKPIKIRKNKVLTFVEGLYSKAIKSTLIHYKKALFIGLAFILVLTSFGFKLGTEFLPQLDEGSIFLRANFPTGVTIQENAKYAPKIRKIISEYPQVDYVITQTGRNDEGTDPFPANRNEILIGLKDYNAWNDTISKKKLVKRIHNNLEDQLPGVNFSVGQPIVDQIREIVTGSASELSVSISGKNLNMMRNKADSIADIIKSMDGSQGVNIVQEGHQDQLSIKINREKSARHGINVSDIQNMVEAAVGGKDVSVLYEGTKRYDIVVRYLPEFRNNIEKIKNLLVPSSKGALIPMKELTDIEFKEGQTNIHRHNNKRVVTVGTDIQNRDQGGFVKELQKRVDKEVNIPKGYEIIYGGQYENLERASNRLMVIVPLTILVIFIMLFMLYKRFSDVAITLTCIVFAIPGGILALMLRGMYFNISAGVGFVSLSGIAIMTGILIINSIHLNLKKNKPLYDSILHSSIEQFKVRLMVILLAMFGLIPAALSTGIGSDIQRPLATVIIGGLISTLIFAPLLIPPLYWWVNKKSVKKTE